MFYHIFYGAGSSQMLVSILPVREKERQCIIEVFRHRPKLMPCVVFFVEGEAGEWKYIRKPCHCLDLYQCFTIG